MTAHLSPRRPRQEALAAHPAPPTQRGMTPLYRALFPRIEAAALAERNPSTLAETVVDLVEDYLAAAPPTLTDPARAWDEGFTAGRPVEYPGFERPTRADNPYRVTVVDAP